MTNRKPAGSNGKNARDDLKWAIGLNRSLLMPLGVWPLKRNASRWKRSERRILLAISVTILLLYVIPQYLSVFLCERTVDGYLQIMAPTVFETLALLKFYVLLVKNDELSYCIGCIEEDWTRVRCEEDRETMYRNARLGRYLTICCIGFMYGGLVPYNVVLPFLNLGSEFTRKPDSLVAKPLPYPSNYVLFNEQSTPIYEITWIIQLIGSVYVCALNCGVFTMTGIFVAHACGQLQVICSKLEGLIDGNIRECAEVEKRIFDIVEHHLYVIRFAKRMNDALQLTFLTDEIGALGIVCFVGYMVITAWSRHSSVLDVLIWIVLMITTTFNIFIISFVGQQLWDKSEEVGTATARVQWYRIHPKLSRSLILCMVRSARSLKLSAFNMFDLTLANFGDVLRGSSVFLNMLRQVTNNKIQ